MFMQLGHNTFFICHHQYDFDDVPDESTTIPGTRYKVPETSRYGSTPVLVVVCCW